MKHVASLRQAFLDYFRLNDHEIVASAPLVPHQDPTLMFVNAGMVPFKHVFTGQESRPYHRAVSSQKCVRAGGKHNDLDNVGYTARHHTFFEMLGNFSFGDYFKEGAIELAWNFVTKSLEIPEDKLLVTVYHEDETAFDLWRKIAGLPEDRIIRIATSDNFWSMGPVGPCGPCSEIFYDHGPEIAGGPPGSPEEDGDRFIEIWNLVFMEFEQHEDGTRSALPKPCIDTGMGLERIAAVMQGVHDNYAIDLFRNLIAAVEDETGQKAEGAGEASFKVIADHLRACGFLLADGVMPANEGRGYVLRRIMRRAMRHAHQLGAREPLMHRLVPALVQEMGAAYPELERAAPLMMEMLRLEEERFRQTLERGLKLLEEETGRLGGREALPGSVAFKLYDTYGFPLDLTQDILRGQGRAVDLAGFEEEMTQQKQRARAAWSGSGEKAADSVWLDVYERVGATEFLGYHVEEGASSIAALVLDGREVEMAGAEEGGVRFQFVTGQTPFYGESGGQAGDHGVASGAGWTAEILDTTKPHPGLHVHHARLVSGQVRRGDQVTLSVDGARRRRIKANHSATHLLHRALRERLGEHVTQKGSLVEEDRLRFDISHPKALEEEDIREVERSVNAAIRANLQVHAAVMTPEKAVEAGALALFGEKYGDEVRVVRMGEASQDVSLELCGGTHVARTGDIGLFRIVSESAIAAGVRRIEAMTGEAAYDYIEREMSYLKATAASLKVPPVDVPARVESLLEERRKTAKELAELRRQAALGGGVGQEAVSAEDVGGVAFIGRVMPGVAAKDLRGIAEELRGQHAPVIVVLVGTANDKASLLVAVSPEYAGRCDAVELVRVGALAVGGQGGGGRPDFAQAGGPDAGAAEQAIATIRAQLAQTG